MAHSAATGSAKRTVDVAGKRLGIKRFGGQFVRPGEIIVRQRGSKFYPGNNTKQGRDFTIYATISGFVQFQRMTGYKRGQKLVHIVEALNSVIQGKETVKTEIDTVEAAPIAEVKPAKKSVARKSTASKAKTAKKAE